MISVEDERKILFSGFPTDRKLLSIMVALSFGAVGGEPQKVLYSGIVISAVFIMEKLAEKIINNLKLIHQIKYPFSS